MTTVEERREAARRLREDAKRYLLEGRFCSNEMPHRLAKAIECRYVGAGSQISELFPRLADLIDPGDTDATATPHRRHCDASATCDRDALLALADEMDGIYRAPDAARWYAKRIREYCGEEADNAEA